MSDADLLIILAGYFIGSIPFAFLVTRLATGRDVRLEGEGNVGGRNAIHIAGARWGMAAMLLDIGKGAGAYWLARHLGTGDWTLFLTWLALVGIGLAVAYRADALALFGLVAWAPWIGWVVTGLVIGRGSNYLHDLIDRWLAPVERP